MILFNELRITSDNKCMIIDAEIDPDSIYDGIILDRVTIATQGNYNPNGEIDDSTQTVVYRYEGKETDITEWDVIKDDTHRHVRIQLQADDLIKTIPIPDPTTGEIIQKSVFTPPIDLSGRNLYFIYVHANVEHATGDYLSAPCGCAGETRIGTIANTAFIYDQLIKGIKGVGDNCSIPSGFIDSFLKLQATDTAIRTGNYPLAIQYWNQFYAEGKPISVTKHCGCHGRY